MEPLRVGVIGCGTAGSGLHLPSLARIEEAEPVALADSSPEALDRAGDRFGIKRRSRDYRQLLDDPSVEAVCIATPNDLHAEMALAAIDAGKHVFVEKPLATSVDDCDLLVERASTSGVRTLLGFNLRWHRHVRKARALIRGGDLGELRALNSVSASDSMVGLVPGWRSDPARAGGVLALKAVHHLDLWRFLLGEEIDQVACVSSPDTYSETGLTTAAMVASSRGGIQISSAFCSDTGQNNEFALYGTAGWLRASIYRFDGFETMGRQETEGQIRPHLRRQARLLAEFTSALIRLRRAGGDFRATYQAEWRHFAEAIRQDGPIECSFEDGREVARILSAAHESARTGSAVRVLDSAPRLPA